MKVWIVGQRRGADWEFQGVFDSHEAAVAACVGDDYFIGPAILNEQRKDSPEKWDGAYFPRLQEQPA